MKPEKETRAERFKRLAEARVNKILHQFKLLGNLSIKSIYSYDMDQISQIYMALQTGLSKAVSRFHGQTPKKRFRLDEPYETEKPRNLDPVIAVPLPDGTCLRVVAHIINGKPSINVYQDNPTAETQDLLCFVEIKDENDQLYIGAYNAEEEDAAYYAPFQNYKNNHTK